LTWKRIFAVVTIAAVLGMVMGGLFGLAGSRLDRAGSTPLHLAIQTTGRGGSGSPEAREQQAGIVTLLLERGARLTDRDRHGKDVRDAATGEHIKALLSEASAR
jgi:hypothetical protein